MDLFCQMKDTHHIRAVQNRISSLLKQNVIDDKLISYEKSGSDVLGRPQILTTLEKLSQQKRFSGLEASVSRVCELIAQGKEFTFHMK